MKFLFTILCFLCAAFQAQAMEAAFPVKPVRWVVPYPPGGSIDIVARALAGRLSQAWGTQCIIDNRAGAGGRLGVQVAIAAPADGYTQLMTLNTNYTIDRSLFKNIGYDPEKALVPIAIVASTAQMLISNRAFPPKNVRELIALAKARPNEINYGSSGAGGSLHLAFELFKAKTGVKMTHVPYKGGPPAATDLIAGQIQVMFLNVPSAAAFIKSGKVRALAVSTARRAPQFPQVPTMIEAGVPGYDIDVWYGLSAPAGVPASAVSRTYQELTRILNEPDTQKQLESLGADALHVSPEEMAKRIRAETAMWAKVIQGSSMRFE
jgi:tripartite-type tricarboxylate transporter receptor subunit TctC